MHAKLYYVNYGIKGAGHVSYWGGTQPLAVVNTAMNLWAPQKAGNLLSSRPTISCSRSTLLRRACPL